MIGHVIGSSLVGVPRLVRGFSFLRGYGFLFNLRGFKTVQLLAGHTACGPPQAEPLLKGGHRRNLCAAHFTDSTVRPHGSVSRWCKQFRPYLGGCKLWILYTAALSKPNCLHGTVRAASHALALGNASSLMECRVRDTAGAGQLGVPA